MKLTLLIITLAAIIYVATPTVKQPYDDSFMTEYIDSVNRCNNNPTLLGCNDPYYK